MLKKIGIIHFGNIEQLLFSAPAIIGIKRRNPDSQLVLFVDKHSKDILSGWEIVDSVYPVDIQAIIAFSKNNISHSLMEIISNQIIPKTEQFESVINFSNEPVANLLATYLTASEKIGAFINAESEIQINGAWSQYQAAVVGKTILNPFHLADLYKYIAFSNAEESAVEIAPYPSEAIKAKAYTKTATGLKIGFILSHQWPIANSVAYIEEILQSLPRATVFLLPSGTNDANSLHIASKVTESITHIAAKSRIIDLMQNNGLKEIHAITNEMHLVVGPLSLTTHLAAASNTFTISLCYLDQAMFERGPYGHGHILLADENQDASELSIPWNLVAGMTRYAVATNGTKTPELEQWREFCGAIQAETSPQYKVFYATRMAFHQQDGNERTDVIYEPILSKGATLQECLLSFYRLIWQFDLNASEDTINEVRISRASTVNGMINLVDALEKLHKVCNFGSTYARYVSDDLRKDDLALARQDSEKLQEIDNMIIRLANEIPAIAPICNFYSISQFQNRESDAIKVADLARLSYERLQVQISIILDLVQELVSKNKNETKQASTTALEVR